MNPQLHQIGAYEAWSSHRDGSGKRIAIIDSGIARHPGLDANVEHDLQRSFVASKPLHAHGTKVAGIIGAVHDPLGRAQGICWYADMFSVRVLSSNKKGRVADVIRAIEYAMRQGAHIINLSIEIEQGSTDDRPGIEDLRQCMQSASRAGVLFVTAAGNDKVDLSERQIYPASFNTISASKLSDITQIVVGAVDIDNSTNAQNYGPGTVDLGAPDSGLSTAPDGQYGQLAATSSAAAFVTGTAALVWTANPHWSASQVKGQILESAEVYHRLKRYYFSGRRLNLKGAVQGPYSMVLPDTPSAWIAGHPVEIAIRKNYNSTFCQRVELHISTTNPARFDERLYWGEVEVGPGTLARIEVTPQNATSRAVLRLRCRSASGLFSYSDAFAVRFSK